MHFLSQGDYNFPFEWITYWVKHFYMWSFQTGTPNPDGLIRLPGRILNFLVFGLFDNVGVAYFYAISSLVIAFVAFFFFARKFLQIKQTSVQVIGALFFALNPIFLGNLAKVGLVLAAAMLPLCLLAIRTGFVRKRCRFFLLYILCINISFLHPYTLTVNLAVSGLYFAYMAWRHRAFVIDALPRFVLVGICAIAANLYFILPIMSMGTVSKDVISTNVTPTPVDYTALVGISNTGDFFTGFSLSKNVFVDFAFYNSLYQNLYFFGVFLFYVILLGLYLRVERHLRLADKQRIGIMFGAFLVLIALAATTVMHVDTLIKLLISMPGGWAFRSPLKWQLYIPLALFGILVILLGRISRKRWLIAAEAALGVTFVLMNAYLFVDIYRKLLVPRTLEHFAALQQTDMNQKTVLFVNNGTCMDFMRANPRITTELNQVFTSKNTQLKHILEDNADTVNLGSYDFVLGCKDRLAGVLQRQYDFGKPRNFVNDTFHLYANRTATPHIYATSTVFSLDTVSDISAKSDFVQQVLRQPFSFVPAGAYDYPTTGLQDVFEHISPQDIRKGEAGLAVSPQQPTNRQFYAREGNASLYYATADSQITLSPTAQPGMLAIEAAQPVSLPDVSRLHVAYKDPRYGSKNLIPNHSFEQGAWSTQVSDCYAFDNQPAIAMGIDTKQASDGRMSLQLAAQRHIACTGPGSIAVEPGSSYLLSFDYQSLGDGKFAGYYVGFDNPAKTVLNERMQGEGNTWQTFSREITIPKDAHHLRLMLYAYPPPYGDHTSAVRYDNVGLQHIPPTKGRFYIVSQPKTTIKQPHRVDYDIVDPTKKIVRIHGASTPFYLATTETYHDLWQLGPVEDTAWKPAKTGSLNQGHIKLNNTMNAWYIDPAQTCSQATQCTRNADGTYDLVVAMEFVPQRWFYIGAIISGLALTGGAVAYIYSRRHDNDEAREGLWRWR